MKKESIISTNRGQYILAQALYVAIKTLDSVKGPAKEVSNINDMKSILHECFPAFESLFVQQEVLKNRLERLQDK